MEETWSLADYEDWNAFCQETAPPLNISMAAFIGFKPKKPAKPAEEFDIDEFLSVVQQFS